MKLNSSDMEKIKELLKEVTSEYKWYAVSPDQSEQNRLKVTANRIASGTVRETTMREFFALFGYRISIEKNIRIEKSTAVD